LAQGERHPRFHPLHSYFDIFAAAMKTVAFWVSLVGMVCSQETPTDESGMSLLQHSARPIRKTNENLDDPPGPPPPGVAERQAARREARRAARAEGTQSNASPEQIERRRARRQAKRQAKRDGHAAASRHFADGGDCDTCASKCNALFDDEVKACLIRENCRPWQKEDGSPPDKCAKRCDRGANWLREPCIRKCECDVDLIGATSAVTKSKNTDTYDWADGHHRCRAVPIGSMSGCTSLAEDNSSPEYDSIKKCAKAAVDRGADTFNFYRTSKEYAKCSLRQCGSGDLQVIQAPPSAEAPAGHGNWKVFSTFCAAPPVDQRNDNGGDMTSR